MSLRLGVPFSYRVTVTCDADGRSEGTASATLSGEAAISSVSVAAGSACSSSGTGVYRCTVDRDAPLTVTATATGGHSGLSLGWSSSGGVSAGSVKHLAAAPLQPSGFSKTSTAELSCTGDGTVTVTVTAGSSSRSVRVDVDCTAPVACDDPLGSLTAGTVARSGVIAADSGCTSPRRSYGWLVRYARRHTFSLEGPATVTIDVGSAASNSPRLDTYVMLFDGRNAGTGTLRAQNDDGGPGTDSRLKLKLPAGDYTIEATPFSAFLTGGYDLRVRTVFDKTVKISGLADAAKVGTGAVTVAEAFTVSPHDADCAVTPSMASVSEGTNGKRTLSARLTAPGMVNASVRCTRPGHGPAVGQAKLTHAGALLTIAARAVLGGECTKQPASGTADIAYRCEAGRGQPFKAAADATAIGATLSIDWTASGAVSLVAPTPAAPGRDAASGGWKRTAAATLTCTGDGTATATAKLPGTTAQLTARLEIDCQDAIVISGLADASRTGTGTVNVQAEFTVAPAAASCTASPAAAKITARSNGKRTLSASLSSPASLEAIVTCTADGYFDAAGTATLTAALPCSAHLGDLATGVTSRTGTIAWDTSCTSAGRATSGSRTYFASRHTFTMTSPGWATIDLGDDPAASGKLDTYLLLLEGHGGTGKVLARDDDSGPHSDSRLSEVFLLPGDYTIEATTRSSRATGGYRLRVDATVTGLQAAYNATVGRELRIDFDIGNYHANAYASRPDLALTAHRNGPTATLVLLPSKAYRRTVTVVFKKPATGSGATAANNNGATTIGKHTISIPTSCSTHQIVDPEFGKCIWNEKDLREERGDRYVVTPALLAGVRRVSDSAVQAHVGECDMTPTRLAALLISIGIWETRTGNRYHANHKGYPRSLMSLSRKDYSSARLYPNNVPGTAPSRAFWHPGIGYWQLDHWRPDLNHAERADVDLAGAEVASRLLKKYCGKKLIEFKNGLLDGAWNACILPPYVDGEPVVDPTTNKPYKDDDGLYEGDHRCFETHDEIYLGGEIGDATYRGIEGLWVTTDTPDNPDEHKYWNNESYTNTKGGVQSLQCRWNNAADPFGCWLYDTDNPEGHVDSSSRNGVRSGDYPSSPYSVPFVSFTHSRKRFAVFPESFAGGTTTWFKHVPVDKLVRSYSALSWHKDDYDIDSKGNDDVLKVQDTTRELSADPVRIYAWVDVAASDFKAAMRRRYP